MPTFDKFGNLKVVEVVSTTIGSAINALQAGTDSITGGTAIFSNANGISFGVDGHTITASVNTGEFVFSNSNNVSFGENAGTVTASASFSQSNQNLSLYALGNTTQNSSTLLNASNLSFKGTGNISVGFSNGSILFSQSGGAGGAAISAGGNSQNTGTIVFSNSNGVTFGLSNDGVLTASHNGITSQSNQAFSAQGGLSAFQTLVFTNSNGVSFSNTNGSVWASVRTDYQSSGNYLTTAMQSGASTQFVQANAVFNGTNASGTIASGGISISVAAPSSAAIAISGNANSQNTGTVNFSNSNGVSFGLSNNGVMTATVKTDYQSSGAYLTTAMQSNAATISNVNLSAGTTSNNLSAMVFSNSNGVSFGLNGSTVTATVATNYQSQGAYLTTAMQSNAATISNIQISAGTLSQTRSDMTFADSNGISFGLETNGVITGTVKTDYQSSGNYLTTAMASDAGSRFVNTSAGLNLTNISATINSNSISLSVADAVAQSNQTIGLYALGNTTQNSSTTFDARTLSFNAIGSITMGYSNGSIQVSAPNAITTGRASTDAVGLNTAQTNVTWTVNSSGISFNAGGYAGTNTAITGGSLTLNTSGISLNLPAYITTARASTDGIGLNTAQTNVTWTVNSSGLSFNAGGYAGTNTATTGGISVTLNTSGISLNIGAYLTTAAQSNQVVNSINGSTGIFSFNTGSSLSSSRNGNSITWGLASDITTALQSAGAYLTTAAQSDQVVNSINGSTGIFTFGTGSSLSSSRNGNSITWGLASNITTALQSAGAYLTTARASTDAIGLNTAQTNVTWTVNSSGLSLNAGGYAGTNTNITGGSVTLNTSGISINIPGSSVSMWPAQPEVLSSTATIYSGSATASNGTATTMSALLFPVVIVENLVFNNMRVWASNSIVTSIASSLTYVQGISLGLYTLNGANLSLASSFTNTLKYTQSTSNNSNNSSAGITMGWGGSSTTFQTGTSTNFSALAVSISGAKMYPLNWTSNNRTLTVGQYFAMLMFSHSTSNSAAGTLQSIGVLNKNLTLPQECMKATSVTVQGWPFLGILSLTINSNSLLPSVFATSDLTTATNNTSNFATSGFLQMYSF